MENLQKRFIKSKFLVCADCESAKEILQKKMIKMLHQNRFPDGKQFLV